MWKKLYSNTGLILLAILAAGIWFSNLRYIYPPKPANDFDVVRASSPTPTPSFEEPLKRDDPPPTPTPQAIDTSDFWKVIGQQPQGQPPTATARCKDGTFSYSANRRGACSHHGGVAQWLRPSLWGNAARKIRSLFAR